MTHTPLIFQQNEARLRGMSLACGMRLALCALVLSCFVNAAPADAQQFIDNQADVVHLTAANMHADVAYTENKNNVRPGDTVSATITILNKTKYRWILTSMALGAFNGSITKIEGHGPHGMKITGRGSARKIKFGRVYYNKPISFTVQMKLGKRVGRHGLKVTLFRIAPRPRTSSQTGQLVWRSDLKDVPDPVQASAVPLAQTTEKGAENKKITPAAPNDPNAYKAHLRAGHVRLSLPKQGAARARASGTLVTSQLKLYNEGRTRYTSATVVLDTEGAKIETVTAKGARIRTKNGNYVLRFARIRRKRPISIVVKTRLGARTSTANKVSNRLRMTVRTGRDGASKDQAALNWIVRNCSGQFYASLRALYKGPGATMRKDASSAAKPIKSRPGHWIYRPARDELPRKRRKKRKFKKKNLPVAKADGQGGITDEGGPKGPDVKPVFLMANLFVKNRGSDPKLSRRGKIGWVTHKISGDLRGYVAQPRNDAICSGATFMMDYFSGKLGAYKKRSINVSARRKQALEIVAIRYEHLRQVAQKESANASMDDVQPGDLRAVLQAISKFSRDDELTGKASSGSLYPLLKDMRKLLAPRPQTSSAAIKKSNNADRSVSDAGTKIEYASQETAVDGAVSSLPRSLTDEEVAATKRLLTAVEAALYLGNVQKHYTAIDKSLIGSISSIRKAHKSSCICE